MKVREGGRVVNGVVLLATGVNGDGHREVLGVRVVTSEPLNRVSYAMWSYRQHSIKKAGARRTAASVLTTCRL